MKQQTQSASRRVYTRDLVRIHQVWQERTRRRVKPQVKIVQVYRHDRQVRARTEAGEVVTINFDRLRKRYRLIETQQGAPK